MAKYSKAKIAKSFIRGNVNFWGGRNIPALQKLMDFAFDPKSVLDKFKVDQKVSRPVARIIDEVTKLHDEVMQEEEKLEKIRRGFSKMVLSLISIELLLVTIDPNVLLNRSIYNLTQSIINTNKLQNKLVPHVFYAINVATTVDRELLRKYAEGIVELRRIDAELRAQDNKVKQKYNALIGKMNAVNANIRTQRDNR